MKRVRNVGYIEGIDFYLQPLELSPDITEATAAALLMATDELNPNSCAIHDSNALDAK